MDWLRRMHDPIGVDEIASATDEDLIRRRFDRSNVLTLTLISLVLFVAACSQVAMTGEPRYREPHLVVIALVHLLAAGLGLASFGGLSRGLRDGTRRPLLPLHVFAANLTPWIIGFLILEFVLVSLFSGGRGNGWTAWGFVFPAMVIPVRLAISRRLALHISFLVLTALLWVTVHDMSDNLLPFLTGIAIVSTACFFAGAWLSRRTRRETITEWSTRRDDARERVRMRDELQYAREVQLSMLPDSAPMVDWLDLAGCSIPATEVGGDYYDYFASDDSVSLVCADIAGHGLGSGIVLASLRAGFTLLQEHLRDPSGVLQRLSELVAKTSRRRMLATAAVLRIERSSGVAILSSAGHPPILWQRGAKVEPIALYAPPLGTRLPHQIPSTTIEVRPGDRFVLHSDGVYESMNAEGEIYGLERLQEVVAECTGSAESVRDAILTDLERFRGTATQQDDVTVVVAIVLAAAPAGA